MTAERRRLGCELARCSETLPMGPVDLSQVSDTDCSPAEPTLPQGGHKAPQFPRRKLDTAGASNSPRFPAGLSSAELRAPRAPSCAMFPRLPRSSQPWAAPRQGELQPTAVLHAGAGSLQPARMPQGWTHC